MADHGSKENGINCIHRRIEYRELPMILKEAVAGLAHVYAYGISTCTFLAGLTDRRIYNLKDINCPPPDSFNHDPGVPCPAISFPNSLAQPKPHILSTIG